MLLFTSSLLSLFESHMCRTIPSALDENTHIGQTKPSKALLFVVTWMCMLRRNGLLCGLSWWVVRSLSPSSIAPPYGRAKIWPGSPSTGLKPLGLGSVQWERLTQRHVAFYQKTTSHQTQEPGCFLRWLVWLAPTLGPADKTAYQPGPAMRAVPSFQAEGSRPAWHQGITGLSACATVCVEANMQGMLFAVPPFRRGNVLHLTEDGTSACTMTKSCMVPCTFRLSFTSWSSSQVPTVCWVLKGREARRWAVGGSHSSSALRNWHDGHADVAPSVEAGGVTGPPEGWDGMNSATPFLPALERKGIHHNANLGNLIWN